MGTVSGTAYREQKRFFVDLVADDDQAGRRQVDWSHCNSAWHSTASGSVQVEPRVGRGGEARQDAIAVF